MLQQMITNHEYAYIASSSLVKTPDSREHAIERTFRDTFGKLITLFNVLSVQKYETSWKAAQPHGILNVPAEQHR